MVRFGKANTSMFSLIFCLYTYPRVDTRDQTNKIKDTGYDASRIIFNDMEYEPLLPKPVFYMSSEPRLKPSQEPAFSEKIVKPKATVPPPPTPIGKMKTTKSSKRIPSFKPDQPRNPPTKSNASPGKKNGSLRQTSNVTQPPTMEPYLSGGFYGFRMQKN